MTKILRIFAERNIKAVIVEKLRHPRYDERGDFVKQIGRGHP